MAVVTVEILYIALSIAFLVALIELIKNIKK